MSSGCVFVLWNVGGRIRDNWRVYFDSGGKILNCFSVSTLIYWSPPCPIIVYIYIHYNRVGGVLENVNVNIPNGLTMNNMLTNAGKFLSF
jgi:hypothetical protein